MGRLRATFLGSRLRILSVFSVLVVGTLILSADVQAQQPARGAAATTQSTTISSGIQVQNLSAVTANVTITYYNLDGSVSTTQSFQVPANSSYTAYGSTMAAPLGFSGSAVVSADQPVAAITNLLTSNPTTGEAYDGVGAPSTLVNVPLVQFNNAGYNTTIYVQNTSSSPNTVTVTWNGSGAPANYSFSLNGNGSFAISSANASNGSAFTGKFVGSAIVSGTQPLAVEVNQGNGSILFSYIGSPSGTPTIYAPLLMNNNHGYSTGLQVQNVGTQTTTVSLFLNGGTTSVASATLSPGTSVTWYPIPGTSSGFVGSGTVTSSAGQPLLGAVNELSTGGQGMTYSTFGSGTQTVNMPLIMFNNAGYYTGEQIQNVGTSTATVDFTINGQAPASPNNLFPATVTLAPGQSFTWYDQTVNHIPGGGKVASAQAHARETGAQIVGIVNEITVPQAAGDTSFSYEGFNQ